jgi:hypothetical protein
MIPDGYVFWNADIDIHRSLLSLGGFEAKVAVWYVDMVQAALDFGF